MATTPLTTDPNMVPGPTDPNLTPNEPAPIDEPEPFKFIPEDATLDDLKQTIDPITSTQPVTQAPDPNFFGTYKTKEDAQKGFDEAQRTIETLKANDQRYKSVLQVHGIPDPAGPLRQQMQGNSPEFLDVFEQAVKNNDSRPIISMFKDMIQQEVNVRVGPMAPILQHANVTRAAEIASTMPNGDPNIPAFVKSESFNTALKAWPKFQRAIQHAQVNTQFADELPEMMAIAYKLANVPVTPQSIPRTTPTSSTPVQTIRSTGTAQSELTRELSKEERNEILSRDWSTIQGIGSV